MDLKDQYKYFVSAYYGVREMDEYDLKVYVLKDIENYIKDFIIVNPIPNYEYKKIAEEVEQTNPLKTKLQDSLIVLNKINGPIELILLVKKRIKKLSK